MALPTLLFNTRMSSFAQRHPVLLFLASFVVLMAVALGLAALAP